MSKTFRFLSGLILASLSLVFAGIVAGQDQNDWHIRIIAEDQAQDLIDRGAVIGELSTSANGIDKHDLPELEPFSTPYLTVVFKKQIDNQTVEFNSDFRAPDIAAKRTEKQWAFTVKSDDSTRDITLKWEGDGRLDQMVLVDLETGSEIYPMIAGVIRSYTFNMAGKVERDFVWKY